MTEIFADQAGSVNWSTTVNTWGVLGLAAMQAVGMWWSDRHRKQSHKELAEVRADVGEVKIDVKNVKRTVDGPMGIALQNAASALDIAAKALPDNSSLILQAVAAQKEADDHQKTMRAVEEEARLDAATKAKIIAEWKAAQNPPVP
jgi:hypothetical protein